MANAFEWISRWDTDEDRICSRIARTPSPLKIILKTRNDPFFIRQWIEHHKNIVGYGGIIIFDNKSNDAALDKIYLEYSDRILFVRFEHIADLIHDTQIFAKLYRALKLSCRYFCVLDTDERLIWVDGDRGFRRDASIRERIMHGTHDMIYPGFWLPNVPGYDDRFWFQPEDHFLEGCLGGGKPVVPNSFNLSATLCHNIQIDASHYKTSHATNIFVLHLSHYSRQQRIRVNISKLKMHGELQDGDGIEEALALNAERLHEPNARHYAREVQRLHGEKDFAPDISSPLAPGSIRLTPDGRIEFENDAQRHCWSAMMAEPESLLTILRRPRP